MVDDGSDHELRIFQAFFRGKTIDMEKKYKNP